MRRAGHALATAAAALAVALAAASPAAAAPRLVSLGSFHAPVDMAAPPGDPRVFVVGQDGTIEVLDGGRLKVAREVEGGSKEINEIELPCVLSIQTGINEPRYVGMRGIRQVASVPSPTVTASDLAIAAPAPKVKRVDYFVPPAGDAAEILQGSREEVVEKLLELLKANGGLN